MIQVGGELPPPDLPVIPPETLMTTYSDSRYGFTIQHPFDCWMVQKGNTIVLAGSGFLSFNIVVTETEKSLEDWYFSLMNKVLEKEKVDELRVNSAWGEMIITRQCQRESGMLLKQVFLVSQGYGYHLQFAAPLEPSNLLAQLEPIIDAMIRSFSLQKPQTTTDPIGSQSQPPSLWEALPPGWERTSFVPSVPPHLVCASSTRIVWSGHRPGATGSEADLADCIYLYDLKEHREKLIWRASRQGGQGIPAFLSGDWLVWVDYSDLLRGSDWILYAWNLSTGRDFP